MVVAFGDQPYARGWFEFVADGCAVFDRSVSSLQYVLRDTERAVHEAVLHRGPAALTDALDTQAAALAAERTRITAHDALDSIEAPRDVDHETGDAALIASDSSRSLTDALMTWMEGVGLSVRRPSPGTIRIDRRRRPQVPFDLETRLAPFQDESLALGRSAAVRGRLPILRAGHPLVDTVAEHLRETDRGIAFALLRPARGQWPPAVVIRTDFQVSSMPPDHFVAEAEEGGLSFWAKQILDEVMPPLVETVLMTIDGMETSHPSLLRQYDKRRGDLNLSSKPDLFANLTAHLDWAAVCSSALEKVERLVRQRSSVVGRPGRAVDVLRARIHQRADRTRARRLADMEVDDVVWSRLEASLPDVLEPRIDVIGCGVIFVADPSRAG
jgi:ATP-dependent helicase HepA